MSVTQGDANAGLLLEYHVPQLEAAPINDINIVNSDAELQEPAGRQRQAQGRGRRVQGGIVVSSEEEVEQPVQVSVQPRRGRRRGADGVVPVPVETSVGKSTGRKAVSRKRK